MLAIWEYFWPPYWNPTVNISPVVYSIRIAPRYKLAMANDNQLGIAIVRTRPQFAASIQTDNQVAVNKLSVKSKISVTLSIG